jgi:polar amino acid transport system substrate-binding protein
MTSEFILLFKDTALLSAVGVFELMLYANNLVARTGNITPFMVAAVYYLLITTPLINWVGSLEARLALSEGGQAASSSPRKQRYWWKKPPDLEPDAAVSSVDADPR